ncbi:MAG: Gfo/Idh/MocA family protein [Planctomycetota bacterium]|jgi:predicted dehydrogenase
MPKRVSRRKFLKTAAAGVTLVPALSVRTYAANEAIGIGMIGVGGQGRSNRHWFKRIGGNNIVALCDVDTRRLGQSKRDHPGAKAYLDYRKMLHGQKDIDAVMVSTPDHHHFPASMLAMRLGKAVATEKPLTHSVWEARQMALAARKYKVATQMDNEGHATEGLRKLVEWVQSGGIGLVREVHIWTNRPIWPQGIPKRPRSKPVPGHLKWDLWIGPAPYRDHHDHLHPFAWRGWWDFGTGALGDMGCHYWDGVVWGLRLGHPDTVEAVQEGNSDETGPHWSTVTYRFPARGRLPAVTVKWWDGRRARKAGGKTKYDIANLPPRPPELEKKRRMPTNGSMFVGEKGTILVSDVSSPRIVPESKMKAFDRPKPFIPRVKDHKIEWFESIRTGKPASSSFADAGGHLAEVVLLGNLAVRTGRKIEWDGENLKATNCPEADRYIRREYRKGWEECCLPA